MTIGPNTASRLGSEEPTEQVQRASISSYWIFSILLVPRLLAAQYSIIGDCDEVYNYWEPTHYLVHGNGFQTWEYSPVYAIRSWTYIAIHAFIVKLFDLCRLTKVQQFYGLRVVFAITSAICETHLVSHVNLYKSRALGLSLLVLLAASAGMFVSATAYLPSTFAMYGVTLAHAISLEPTSRSRTVKVFTTIGITAIISWPFAAVLASVLALQEIADSQWTRPRLLQFYHGILSAASLVFLVLVVIVGIDSMAYRRFQIVPLNIVLYNVFSGKGRGPDIFGTEPWWYYIFNLSLYFNISFFAALLSLPLMLASTATQMQKQFSVLLQRNVTLASVYVWIGIFIVQPHKEERFMYVIYPLTCYNAAHALGFFMDIFDFVTTKLRQPRHFERHLRSLILWGLALVYVAISAARIFAQIRGFSAPMQVLADMKSSSTVCLGKEWYRFPSSFFIPETSRAMFVKSAFDGLLPGRFPEEQDLGWAGGICKVPASMNDQNLEELSHLVPLESCDYLFDSDFPHRYQQNNSVENELEPRHCIDSRVWSRRDCRPFLDSINSGIFGRSIWLPIKQLDRTAWGEFCLLQRKGLKAKN